MAKLASKYQNRGQWKDAEGLEVQVMETRETVALAQVTLTLRPAWPTWPLHGKSDLSHGGPRFDGGVCKVTNKGFGSESF